MVFDLTLKENTYFLKIHKNLFINKSAPLVLFAGENQLMEKYSEFGIFQISGVTFGFDGCFRISAEEEDYKIYEYELSKDFSISSLKKMLYTISLTTYFVVDQMFEAKEFFSGKIWKDQALSFVMRNNSGLSGYAIGGYIYPWLEEQFSSLEEEERVELRNYVVGELKRIYFSILEKDFFLLHVDVEPELFFVEIDGARGKWVCGDLKNGFCDRNEIYSHNIDSFFDQYLCFVSIIAANSWFRKREHGMQL